MSSASNTAQPDTIPTAPSVWRRTSSRCTRSGLDRSSWCRRPAAASRCRWTAGWCSRRRPSAGMPSRAKCWDWWKGLCERDRDVAKTKGRVFSGARPTGRPHLGNYLGAIQNYVALQDDYECIYCVVDLHALTTLEITADLKENTREMVLDFLAASIRPEGALIFVPSHGPEVPELHTTLSMVTPLGKLTDLPTFKEMARLHPHNVNYGLVGYPVLMTAGIVLYKTNVVPVGLDQAPP